MDARGILKSYVVFGASGGVGSAVVRILAGPGTHLMVSGRDESKLAKAATELPGSIEIIAGDCSDVSVVERVLHAASLRFGRVDGVACCIGSLLLKPAHLTADTEWAACLDGNLTLAFRVLRGAVRLMMQTGGSIVLVSSAAARRGLANHEAVSAAKAGVIGLTLSAAATYAPYGIRVNCVAPGMVRTALTDGLIRNPATLQYSTSLHALGRIGEPADVARAIAWLLDPDQSWVTGQVLGVDGGLSSVFPRSTARQNS